MKWIQTFLILGLGIGMLLSASFWARHVPLNMHNNPFINTLLKQQIGVVITALTIAFFMLKLNPESRSFLRFGSLNHLAGKELWLGIDGKQTWVNTTIQLLVFISLATGIFMFFTVKNNPSLVHFSIHFIPWILLFACTNALSEELIFRFGVIAGLSTEYSEFTIRVISAILFGLPHFMGNPGGILGVIMASVLGYILCKATLETQGLGVAWLIHFVQDILIFTALMMMHF